MPLLYDVCNTTKYKNKRKVIGLSALPGTGKTTLGLLIERLALKMNMKVSVVSMDDFYLPFSEMKIAYLTKEAPQNFPFQKNYTCERKKNEHHYSRNLHGLESCGYWRKL